MNSKARNKSSRYISFSRFLLLFFLFLIIVLYIVVYIVVNRELRANAFETANHLYSRITAVSGECSLVYDSLIHTDDIRHTIGTQSPDQERVHSLTRSLKLITDTNPYINHIYLFNFSDGKIFSEMGSFAAKSENYLLSTFGGSREMLTDVPAEGNFHLFNNMMFTPCCVYPVNLDGSQTGAMVICLDMTQFMRIFGEIDASICTIFSKNAYVSSYPLALPEGFDWSDVSNVASLSGSDVFCYYLSDDSYTYMIAKEKSSYNRPLTMIAIIFAVYAVVMFAAVLISFLRNRKRVRARYALLAEILPDTFAGDSSFGQMYDRIQSSLKDYSIQKEQFANATKEKNLFKVLSDNTTPADIANTAGVPNEAQDYYIAAFSARMEGSAADEAHDRREPALIQRAAVTELAGQQHLPFAACETEYAFVVVFYNIQGADGKERVIQLCNDAVTIINSNYQIPSRVIISDTVSSRDQLFGVWQSLSELQRFIYSVNSRSTCIRMDNISRHADLLDNSDYIRQEQILINTILARKYEIIPDLASSILSSYVISSGDDYRTAQQRFISVRNILAEGVRSSALQESTLHADTLYQCESIDELNTRARQIYLMLTQNERNAEKSGSEVSAIQSYIDHNLSDPNLSVSMVSEAANINLSRLIRIFQSETGQSVADYINFQRIQTAKNLLRETNMTVAQIAEKVGYNNADTFTRNFRKQRNMTPTEYRRFHEKQNTSE